MTHELEMTMKEKITAALRTALGQRKEAIRERLLSCLADHVEQELNNLAEPPALEDSLFVLPPQSGEAPQQQPAAFSPAPSSPTDLSELLQATQKLTGCEDQVSILECLIEAAARFSGRSVVFVCRNGQAMGWEQSGFAANPYSMAIRGAALPLSEESVLSRVVSSGEALSSDEVRLADPVWSAIGTDPSTEFTAVPLTVRGRIAAILFADAGVAEDTQPVQADGLCILARMAEVSLETMTLRAEQGQAQPGVAAQQQEAAAPAPQSVDEPRASVAPVDPAVVAPPPAVMSPPPGVADPEVSEECAPEESPRAEEPEPEPGESPQEDCVAVVEEDPEPVQAQGQEMAGAAQDEAASPAEAPAAEESAGDSPSAETAASEPPAPKPDTEEERLHEQARRFARLLISEILLYNPDQVHEGKHQGDLADRLKEDLERSEQMYRQRVAPHVAAETNYFHEEVLRTLADGDPAALGN